jgi:hypothetical protein
MSDERCQRCGELGQDRRTLWMACFYAMDEMPVPFTELAIHGRPVAKSSEAPLGLLGHTVTTYAEPDESQPPRNHPFYTLRVCKDCRASWMAAIEHWFLFEQMTEIPESGGSGIFIRHRGGLLEVSRETYARLYPGREPHVVINTGEEDETVDQSASESGTTAGEGQGES